MIKTSRTFSKSRPLLNNHSTVNPTRNALLDIDRFKHVSDSTLNELATSALIATYEKGETVFVQGEVPLFFFLVYSGFLKIQRLLPDDRETLIGIYGRGQSIGEIALQLNSQLPVTAIPLVPCRILKIPRKLYIELSADDHHFAKSAAQSISNYSIHFIERMHGNALGRMEQQLVSFFETLTKSYGTQSGKWISLPFPLSRQEIANSLNCRIETVIRTMRKFEAEGLIETLADGFRFQPQFFSKSK